MAISDQTLKTLIEDSTFDDAKKKELIEVIPGMTDVEKGELVINIHLQRGYDELEELENLPIHMDTTSEGDAQKIIEDFDAKKKLN